MKELAIVRYIKEHGLSKAINDFKLKSTIYDKKILLKYDQLESPMGFEEVQDCRGLILEKDTWKVLSLGLRKFFNYGEGHAAKIDLNSSRCLFKKDGTFTQLYFDWNKNEWCVGTTGTAEAEGEVNNMLGTTFSDLFWGVVEFDLSELDKNLVYVFELCTPENIVVTPHITYSITLLMIRDRVTLEEIPYELLGNYSKSLGVELIESINMVATSLEDIKNSFNGVPFSFEGYVIIDKNFNRVKIKNPAYLAAHMLKGKSGFHHILDIIKTGETGEFISTFPNRHDEIIKLETAYNQIINRLNNIWVVIQSKSYSNRKEMAEDVFKITSENNVKQFSSVFFSLIDGKTLDIKEYIFNYDNKKLYEYIKSNLF